MSTKPFQRSPLPLWARRLVQTLAVGLLTYALVYGLTVRLPRLDLLEQSSRNLFYHVPMWFSMYLMMFFSILYSLLHLVRGRMLTDWLAAEFARTGVLFGVLGLLTGMVWARVSWGATQPPTELSAWWTWDPKQTLALAAVLMYLAYFVLRGAVEEPRKRARLAAVYNVFAAASLVPLTLIIPRTMESLHPGSKDAGPLMGGAISDEYRVVFYPAILGFMFLGLWVTDLLVRYRIAQARLEALDPVG